jgi:hypothetical protein
MGYGRPEAIAYKKAGGCFERPGSWSLQNLIPVRPRPARVLCLLLGGLIACAGLGVAADARPYKRAVAKTPLKRVDKTGEEAAGGAPPQVHLVVVSIPKQRISIFGPGGFHRQSAVSTGMRGFPTPTGVFSVIQKNRYHRSNIYSGAPMPFMQRITWSGVAMHAGILPGYPASHGCIRLTHSFAAELWTMTKMGARIVVAPQDVQPVGLAHPALPTPTLAPATDPVAEGGRPTPALVPISTSASAAQGEAAPAARLLSPLERAKAQRARIVAEAPGLAKAAKEASQASAAKAMEANKALTALRDAERARDAARSRHEAAVKVIAAAKDPEETERAQAAEAAARFKLEEAAQVLEEAAAVEAAKTNEAFAAAQAAWDAERRSEEAAAVVRLGERGMEPISVFVSRKTGKVYVRQAWKPIHEAPVAVKDPDTPLGTHVYVAMEAEEDGKAMRWLAVSLPASQPEKRQTAKRGDRAEAVAAPSHPAPRTTAAGALERLELPEEVRKLVSDRLWAGASLIVSDHGLSHETGKYTDFIVLTR